MRNMLIISTIIGAAFAASCVDDDNRCGDLEWDTLTVSCVKPQETSAVPDTDTIVSTDAPDSSPPPVLGEACTTDADCAVYNATYCLPAQDTFFCTLKNCLDAGITCPTGYSCCDAIAGADYLTHCMPQDVFDQMGGMLCTNAN